MYQVINIIDNGLHCLCVLNAQGTKVGCINLDRGANLQELILGDKTIIDVLNPLQYSDTYASSILFPFANRVRDGIFRFRESEHHLNRNDSKHNNAIHGFLYNTSFTVQDINCSDNKATVGLVATVDAQQGFPYTYRVYVTYTWSHTVLDLKVNVLNLSDCSFPYTMGWHPYFYSSNLEESTIDFKSEKEFVYDHRQLPASERFYDDSQPMALKGMQLDNGYVLKSTVINFTTPDYKLKITASSGHSYLQLYMPPKKNFIAIEPMTGAVDAFNNGKGLGILESGDTFKASYRLELE